MPATTNSSLRIRVGMLSIFGMLTLANTWGQPATSSTNTPSSLHSKALRNVDDCREVLKTNATTITRIKFAKEAFLLGDITTDSAERESVALEGIETARAVLSTTNLAAGNYYLALNLGELARTRTLTAISLIKQMEQHFKEAIRLDETYDNGGPHRHLGNLYLEAPGWPVSIGNRANARLHIEKALLLAPKYPENLLLYAEALVRWSEFDKARQKVASLQALLSKMRETFDRDQFAQLWADWHLRLDAVLGKLSQSGTP